MNEWGWQRGREGGREERRRNQLCGEPGEMGGHDNYKGPEARTKMVSLKNSRSLKRIKPNSSE